MKAATTFILLTLVGCCLAQAPKTAQTNPFLSGDLGTLISSSLYLNALAPSLPALAPQLSALANADSKSLENIGAILAASGIAFSPSDNNNDESDSPSNELTASELASLGPSLSTLFSSLFGNTAAVKPPTSAPNPPASSNSGSNNSGAQSGLAIAASFAPPGTIPGFGRKLLMN